MTHQLDIFLADMPRRFAEPPRAARNDPVTSHIAAKRIKSSGVLAIQLSTVSEFVKLYPGRTSAELAQLYAQRKGGTWQEHRAKFGRRLPDLAHELDGRARRGEQRECKVTGSQSLTWWPR